MDRVETFWSKFGKISFFFVGVPLFFVGILFFVLMDGNMAFFINAFVWLGFGLLGALMTGWRRYKLARLKREGVCYEGMVTAILPASLIRIGAYVTAKVECVYKDKKDHTCLVQGPFYLFTRLDVKENFRVHVYVQEGNPKIYEVELFRNGDQRPKIDFDYR